MESDKGKELPACPREKTNILSYLFFWWVLPIFIKGNKESFTKDDLYQPLNSHKSSLIGDKLCKAWDNEMRKFTLQKNNTKKYKPKLLKAILRVYGWKIVSFGFMLCGLEFLLRLTQPLFLGGLIAYYSRNYHNNNNVGENYNNDTNNVNSDKLNNINEAYLYAGGVVLCSALNVIFMHPYMLSILHIGMKLRVAMCSMIYRKALRLSKNALGDTTVGQVVNLLSNDVGRLDLSVIFIHYLWVGPLETIVCTYLIYRKIGISAVFGVAFLLLFIPLQAYLGKKTSILRLKTALRTDERVRLMNEIIQGIQVIKMYAWERPFSELIEKARKKEIHVIRYVSYIRGILLSFIMFTTRVSIFISLVCYVLLGNVIDAEKAFVVTCYYNILRSTMTVFFPQGIGQLAETLVSIKRIEDFMLYDEKNNDIKNSLLIYNNKTNSVTQQTMNTTITTTLSSISLQDDEKRIVDVNDIQIIGDCELDNDIELINVNARWNPEVRDLTLNNINLKIKKGSLIAVVGTVGAGKSSLFQAILGELPIESGEIKVNNEISYSSQEPWLFSGTIRQNILFGKEMNKEHYKNVIKYCALEYDIKQFKMGDKTVIGERGQSLSGGQKARINLARCCYRNTNIYLLDDPLSAVDSHVGNHLFEKCIKKLLNNKTRILITHQLQYLEHTDLIIVLDDGKIQNMDTYQNLITMGLDFGKLLQETDLEENVNAISEKKSRERNSSVSSNDNVSINSLNDESAINLNDNNKNDNDEKVFEGKIEWKLYTKYFKAGGGFCMFYVMSLFCILAQIAASTGDYFLTFWVNKADHNAQYAIKGTTRTETDSTDGLSNFFTKIFNDYNNNEYIDIYIFSAITIATIVITISRSFIFFNLAMKASKNLHNQMFNGISYAHMYFFNTNPSGRILNRFSKDMGQIDEILPAVMIDVIQIFLTLGGIVIVVVIVNVWLLIPTVLMGFLFYYLRFYYLKTSRSLKRIEAITRSPIYSHLTASLNGLTTIRSFNAETILIKEFDNIQDLHSSAFYLFLSTSRAFGFWLDILCVIYIFFVTISFFIIQSNDMYGGNIGLAITQALGMTGMVQWGMRQSAELENTMTSVERIVEYEDLESETKKTDKKLVIKEWPNDGIIKFDNLSLTYKKDTSDFILKKLNFNIKKYEKIGIVGRTGAGKSSIINSIFRLSYNHGSIYIDNYNTNDIDLYYLRKNITIIPQEPIIFSGTIRFNLDPFNQYNDSKLWDILEEIKLKTLIQNLPNSLYTKLNESGNNLSIGQRQLICLGRAILRNNKIIIMDEATSNIDHITDKFIQKFIKEKFLNCTIITIAHRLNTIIDYDRILLMDNGEIIEYDTPYNLLINKNNLYEGVFSDMIKQTGQNNYDLLLNTVKENHKKRINTSTTTTSCGDDDDEDIPDINNKKQS